MLKVGDRVELTTSNDVVIIEGTIETIENKRVVVLWDDGQRSEYNDPYFNK
jgi:hypothetical protein